MIFAIAARQPRPDPRLRRHGQLRPRRLPGARRLCGRHPRVHGVGAAWCSGRWRSGLRRSPRSLDRRRVAAHQRRVVHHDHAGLRADALLPRHLDTAGAATTACGWRGGANSAARSISANPASSMSSWHSRPAAGARPPADRESDAERRLDRSIRSRRGSSASTPSPALAASGHGAAIGEACASVWTTTSVSSRTRSASPAAMTHPASSRAALSAEERARSSRQRDGDRRSPAPSAAGSSRNPADPCRDTACRRGARVRRSACRRAR